MKVLADEFDYFFSSVGVRAAETAKSLASVNGLPSQPLPAVTFVTEEFQFHPVSPS